MKNLDKFGVQELSTREMQKTEGGFIDFIYEYVTGRSLAQDARALTKEIAKAHAQVRAEGGKTSIDMPFP